jgi:hypothetical protein
VTAVGSRNVDSAKKFIAEYAVGDSSIKAYGSYAEVYADSVRGISLWKYSVKFMLNTETAKNVDAVYIGWW